MKRKGVFVGGFLPDDVAKWLRDGAKSRHVTVTCHLTDLLIALKDNPPKLVDRDAARARRSK